MNLTVNLGALVVTLSDDELGPGRVPCHASNCESNFVWRSDFPTNGGRY